MCQLFVNNLNVNCDFECEDNKFLFYFSYENNERKWNG